MTSGRATVGHPVDVGSGEVFSIHDDFAFYSTIPLVWRRAYSTASGVEGWLGRGWTTPYFMTLVRVGDDYHFTDEEGHLVVFTRAESGVPEEQPLRNLGAAMELRQVGDYLVVRHWHPGGAPVEHYGFRSHDWEEMPLAWCENLAGHRISIEYDAARRPVRVTQELERRVIALEYDARELIQAAYLVRENGERELLVRYEYDVEGRLAASINAVDERIEYEYDALHRLVRETGPLGGSFWFRYDELGRCVHTSGDGGFMERRLQYFATPKRTRVFDSAGQMTEYLLNAAGQVLQKVSPLGAVTTNEFDELGRLVKTIELFGAETTYIYDQRGDRVAVVAPNGAALRVRYDDAHLPIEVTDALGGVTTFDYDPRGNLLALTNALGNTFSYVRDPRGLVVEARTPLGYVLRHSYDERLRWQESRDRFGVIQRVEYDEFGNVVTLGDAEGVLQRFTYGRARRLATIETVGEASLAFTWNALGEPLDCVAVGGRHERWQYDRFGQLIAQMNSLGATLRVEYDGEGRPAKVIDRGGEPMEMRYDADGNLVEERLFDGRLQRYEYDPGGQRTRIVLADGRAIRQRFDVVGNLIGRESEDGSMTEVFVYDAASRLTLAENRETVAEFRCDVLGRLTSESLGGRTVRYEYDADNNRVARSFAGVALADVQLTVDGRGRLTALADAAGPFQSFEWDALDRLTRRSSSGGVTESFRYDAGRRVDEQVVTVRGARPVIRRRYAYDILANLVGLEDMRSGTWRFECDALGRLRGVDRNNRVREQYDYDANGTTLSTHRGARAVAPGGRTLTDEVRRYEYDDCGHVVLIADGGTTMRLEHDINGQLVRAVRSDGVTAAYTYDALGRRATKRVNDVTTEFIWDGGNLAAEFRGERLSDMYIAFNQDVIAHWRAGKRLIPIRDRAAIVREQLGDEGEVQWQATLDAFGNLLTESGGAASPFRMRGQYHDRETGLHYNFYRYYSPLLGDYISPDPVGLAGGANAYAYPRNPLSWDDPFGLTCTNKHKGQMGERRMDKYYKDKGFSPAHTKGRPRGIDGIYKNDDPNGKPEFIIVESKYGSSQPRRTVDGNMQLSDGWCNSAINGSGSSKTRVEAALDPAHAADFNAAAKGGDVRKDVYHAPAGQPGYSTQHGDYDPKGSSPDLASGSPIPGW